MDTLVYFLQGIFVTLEPGNILMMLVGLNLGIIGGMLPGISSVTTLALFVPFTFSMSPATALIALGAIYMGATYGGSISSILIKTPGQPASLATALEGYQMTRKGEGKRALDVALIASAYGGVFGGVMLLFFFEPLSAAGLKFGSESFFWLALLGMSALATLYPGNVLRSLLGGLIGMAVSTVGMDPTAGLPRFTMGIMELMQGLDMVVVMIGIFSITQMLTVVESNTISIVAKKGQAASLWKTGKEVLGRFRLINSCSFLGTFIGILPGAGGTVASIIAYNEAKRFSKTPEKYGQGFVDGIIAPESANNGSVGGALVPLLSLGIPGSAAAAVIVGGLMAQGISPGPQLLEKAPDIAYAFIAGICICSLVMIPCGYLISRGCVRLLDLSGKIIVPSVITLSCIGAYALRNSMFDVGVTLFSGGIGYLLLKGHIPAGSIALGLVLGPIVEENLIITMLRARSSDSLLDLMVFSPLAFVLILCCLFVLFLPFVLNCIKRKNNTFSFSFNTGVFKKYEFYIIIFIMLISIPFLHQTLSFDEESRIYPLVVYGLIVIFCMLIIINMMIFSSNQKKNSMEWSGIARSFIVFIFSVSGYYLINIFGFYVSMILVMFFIILCWEISNNEVINIKTISRNILTSCFVIFFQYVCFSILLNVDTPSAILM